MSFVGNVARSNELIYTDKDTTRPVAGISVWEGSGPPNAVESIEGAMPLPRKFLEFCCWPARRQRAVLHRAVSEQHARRAQASGRVHYYSDGCAR